MRPRWLIAGLGNYSNPLYQPPCPYSNNRHNIGMMFLDYLIHHNNYCNNSHHQLLLRQTSFQYDKASGCLLAALQTPPSTATPSVKSSFDVLLSKPVGWMNTSGVPVAKLMRNYHDCRLIIVHDELERPLGKWSWKLQGSASGHNGIKSIISSLGTDKFTRIRLGIGRPASRAQVTDYVLSDCSADELSVFQNTVFPAVSKELINMIYCGSSGNFHPE